MPKKVINNEKFAYLRGGLVKKRGWCFLVFEWWRTEVHTLMYTMSHI